MDRTKWWRHRGEGGAYGLNCSLTTWYPVHPTPCGVCNDLAVGSVMWKSGDYFSSPLLFSLSQLSEAPGSSESFEKHSPSPPYLFECASTFPSSRSLLDPTVFFFLSPTPPSVSFHYIFISLSWERSPPHRGKGKGAGTRRPRGKHFHTQRKLSQRQRLGPAMGDCSRGRGLKPPNQT